MWAAVTALLGSPLVWCLLLTGVLTLCGYWTVDLARKIRRRITAPEETLAWWDEPADCGAILVDGHRCELPESMHGHLGQHAYEPLQ